MLECIERYTPWRVEKTEFRVLSSADFSEIYITDFLVIKQFTSSSTIIVCSASLQQLFIINYCSLIGWFITRFYKLVSKVI